MLLELLFKEGTTKNLKGSLRQCCVHFYFMRAQRHALNVKRRSERDVVPILSLPVVLSVLVTLSHVGQCLEAFGVGGGGRGVGKCGGGGGGAAWREWWENAFLGSGFGQSCYPRPKAFDFLQGVGKFVGKFVGTWGRFHDTVYKSSIVKF